MLRNLTKYENLSDRLSEQLIFSGAHELILQICVFPLPNLYLNCGHVCGWVTENHGKNLDRCSWVLCLQTDRKLPVCVASCQGTVLFNWMAISKAGRLFVKVAAWRTNRWSSSWHNIIEMNFVTCRYDYLKILWLIVVDCSWTQHASCSVRAV